MTLNEIIAGIRRDTREPSPLTAADTYITEIVYRGLNLLWDALILSDKAFGKKRAALSSDTNVFIVPDDCRTILNVWDMRTNAKDITGATNASPIVVTSASHGYTDDAIITISGLIGNIAANGVWKVASAATDTFELYGSTGDGAYVSGGKLYQESNAYTLLTQVMYREVYYTNRYEYYMEKGKININNRTFTNDLVLDYEKFASDDITNVPAEFHDALVSYGVVYLARTPSQGAPQAGDVQSSIQYHTSNWTAQLQKAMSYKLSHAPERFPDTIHWGGLTEWGYHLH